MNNLIDGMSNADGKISCRRCDATFVVYFKEDMEVDFCPSCGVVMSQEHVIYVEDE